MALTKMQKTLVMWVYLKMQSSKRDKAQVKVKRAAYVLYVSV
jgi:hypothetical protein